MSHLVLSVYIHQQQPKSHEEGRKRKDLNLSDKVQPGDVCTADIRLFLGLGFELIETLSEIDRVLLVLHVAFVSFVPIVGTRVGKQLSSTFESTTGDRLIVHRITGLQFRSIVFIPETVPTVTADRGERSVNGMEGDIVHGEDILSVVRWLGRRTVAFEGEVVRVGIGWFDVHEPHDRHPAFDGTDGESIGIARFIGKDGNTPVLIFQQRFDLLIFRGTLIQRVDLNSPISSGDYGHRAEDIGSIDSFAECQLLQWSGLPCVPEFHWKREKNNK